ELGKGVEAARLFSGFDFRDVARRDPGRRGEGLAGQAAVLSPYPYRVLAGDQAIDQLGRQIIGPRRVLALRPLGGLDLAEARGVLRIFEAVEQRLVLRSAERNRIAIAHR